MFKAGELDTRYGENGYAKFPAIQPGESAYIAAITQAPDGSLAACWSTQDSPPSNYFMRLTPEGKWDSETGHKLIAVPAGQDATAGHFAMLTQNRTDNSNIAQATTYYAEGGVSVETAAVGLYDQRFTASPSFGAVGISLHKPDDAPTAPNSIGGVKVLRSVHAGGAIRSLYMAQRDTDSAPTAWIALLDPLTGAPLKGLGQDRNQTQLALPILDVEPGTPKYPLDITDSYFFDDGSFLLAGSADWRQVIAKFNADGLLDASFGILQVAAYRKTVNVSVDLVNERIVTVAGTPRNFGDRSALVVRRFMYNGQPDTDFGGNGLVNVYMDYEWNRVSGISIDAEQRVIIATEQRKGIQDTIDATVTRLLEDGELDTNFGTQGHFQIAGLQLEKLLFNEGELKLLTRRANEHFAVRLHV
ncbi:hypothetical protein DV532_12605 [Pseudomonas sp. Leaf58]|uniref:hypothetical protein n=1 Tax=Pseudomonas sp. Leaf58 TaxID=1736226 RepID=UPI0006FE7888|nr:hypothetical protein [Pseudomonas sp. Leaf58]AYG45090.1 hypothetical protein DV532_12605 [Pseudomonas sp. Leaf58]KQN59366.1 hypothetical protein ASF02_21150 [Pseudomonas sp. Leaf58]